MFAQLNHGALSFGRDTLERSATYDASSTVSLAMQPSTSRRAATRVFALGSLLVGSLDLAQPLEAQDKHSRVTLEIHSIQCIDESGGKYWERIGGDEIVLSGVAVNHLDRARRVTTLRAGYFKKDGAIKRFSPPHGLTSFELDGQGSFPREFQTYLVLVERDEKGGFGPFIDRLVAKVNAGEAIGNGSKGSVGALSTKDISRILTAGSRGNVAALKELGGTVWRKLGDDIFPPALAERSIKSPTALFSRRSKTSAPQRAVVKAHGGKYEITYSWRLSE